MKTEPELYWVCPNCGHKNYYVKDINESIPCSCGWEHPYDSPSDKPEVIPFK